MSTWWALAVVDRRPSTLPACSLGEGALEVVELDGCALIAAHLDQAPAIDVGSMRAHDAMVRALIESGVAVLPARFGSVGGRAEDLAAPLRARSEALREALDRVRGAVQITVRARGGPSPEEEVDDAHDGGPGARFLRRRARALTPTVPGWETISAELRPLIRLERIERGDARIDERWHAYHLVDRDALDAYRAAAARVQSAAPEWALSFGAPSPPYAFAPGAMT